MCRATTNPGINSERRLPADLTHRLAKRVDMHHEQIGTAVEQITVKK